MTITELQKRKKLLCQKGATLEKNLIHLNREVSDLEEEIAKAELEILIEKGIYVKAVCPQCHGTGTLKKAFAVDCELCEMTGFLLARVWTEKRLYADDEMKLSELPVPRVDLEF